MNLLAPVSSIMVKDVVSLPSIAHIKEAYEIFGKKKFHHIPVVDNGELVGIISKSDFAFFSRGFNNGQFAEEIARMREYDFTVADFMTTKLATLDPDDRINVVLEVFKENLFHALPVTEGKKLVGIITTHDIIKQLAVSKGAVNNYDL